MHVFIKVLNRWILLLLVDLVDFNAPAGYEYTYLDFASALGVCSPGFSGTVGTPSTPGCYGSCTYAGPSSYLGPTNGCGGQTWVTARWTNCAGVDLGYVSIDDF
jgi:hypothetical protein